MNENYCYQHRSKKLHIVKVEMKISLIMVKSQIPMLGDTNFNQCNALLFAIVFNPLLTWISPLFLLFTNHVKAFCK